MVRYAAHNGYDVGSNPTGYNFNGFFHECFIILNIVEFLQEMV